MIFNEMSRRVILTTLNRLDQRPFANSREMRAYMAAILEVTGMMAGQSFPIDRFMDNYRTHLRSKTNFPHATIVKLPGGSYALTPEGKAFFSSRFTPNPAIAGQKVSRSEVIEMIRRIVALCPEDGWSRFEVTFDPNNSEPRSH